MKLSIRREADRRGAAPALLIILSILMLFAVPGAQLGALAESVTVTPTLTPDPANLSQLVQYLDTAWNAQDWVQVLTLIDAIAALDPNYEGLADKRYLAHINYGYELLTESKCTEALDQFRQAQLLRPDGQEATMGLELVGRYCTTLTPVITVTPGATPATTPVPGSTPVPGATLTPTPHPLTDPIQYTVVAGDTLYSLAKRYGTTVQAIMAANGMLSYALYIGEVIWIPASNAPDVGLLVHIVQPGETLYSIAAQYNTTVWAIMAANGLSSSTIWAYRALFIPSATTSATVVHVVQPGETLYTISQQYSTTVALIMAANGLTNYTIYVYQQLLIPPVGWPGWPALVPGGPVVTPPATSGGSYYVQPGDTLYSIAQKHGVTVAALKAANGLSSDFILAGVTLRIP